jgi:hypothetical protein
MAPAAGNGNAPELYCPNCGRRLDVLSSSVAVCGRCGVMSDSEPAPPTSHQRPHLYLVDSSPLTAASPAPPLRARPQARLPRKYRCHNCPPGCDFLPRLREALREWQDEHPGQRLTAQAIAGKLGYSDRHLRRLRDRHGLQHWPPPREFYSHP